MSVIANKTGSTIVSGSTDNDIISNSGSKVSINGGAGNDSIRSTGGTNVTLNGGAGNDTLVGSSKADMFQFSYDSGSDIITNYGTNDTLHIIDGSINSYYSSGNDLIVKVKKSGTTGTLRLKNAADMNVKVKVGSKSVTTLNAVKEMFNLKGNATVKGTTSRDAIFNYADKVTVNAAASKDTIANAGDYVSINGGDGNDYIHNINGEYVTLNGGTGNDSIIGSGYYLGGVFQIQSSRGNDTISNFESCDTLNVVDGSISTYYVKDGDMIISIKGTKSSASVRLVNYGDNSVQILDAAGSLSTINTINEIRNFASNTLITGTKERDHIYNSGYYVTIDGGANGDQIYGSYSYYSSINGGAGNDFIDGGYYYSTLKGGAGNDTIRNWEGNTVIQFGAGDGHDLVIGFNAGDTLNITDGSISAYDVNGNDLVVTVKGAKSTGMITLKDAAKTMVKVLSANGELSTIRGYNVINNRNRGTVINGTSGKDYIYNGYRDVTINAGASADYIDNGGGFYVSINAGAGNDTIVDPYGVLTVVGGAGNDFVSLRSSSHMTYRFGAGDGNDTLTHISDNDTIQILSGTVTSNQYDGDDYVLTVKNDKATGTIRIKDIGVTPVQVRSTAGKLSVPNYTKFNVASNQTVNGTSSADLIFNGGNNVKLNAGKGNDLIYNASVGSYLTIDAGAGNDTIYGYNLRYVSINGGTGNDGIYGYGQVSTIRGGAGNDTVWSGSDILWFGGYEIVYQFGASDGNDLITSFRGEGDTLQITDGSISGYHYTDDMKFSNVVNGLEYNGVGLVVSVSSSSANGTVSLAGGYVDKNAPIVVHNADNKMSVLNYDKYNFDSYTVVSGTKSAYTIYNCGECATINAGAGNDIIYDNSGYSVSHYSGDNFGYSMLNGGAGNDSIRVFSNATVDGGAGNDTIYGEWDDNSINGGDGNDFIHNGYGYYSTLKGGAGNDTIISSSWNIIQFGAGDGNDLVIGFDTGDTLQITNGVINNYYASDEDFVIEVKSGSTKSVITLQDRASYSITVCDAEGEIDYLTVDNNSELPAPSLEDYWFDESDTNEGSPLEQIVSNDHSVELDYDQLYEVFRPATLELTAARHRSKK